MKHKASQVPIKWDKPEPFSLVVEQSLDGERIAREKQARAADLELAARAQPDLLLDWQDTAKQYAP